MAAVVVNCPPFKGALTACHPHRAIHCRHADAVKRQCWPLAPSLHYKVTRFHHPALPRHQHTTAPRHRGAPIFRLSVTVCRQFDPRVQIFGSADVETHARPRNCRSHPFKAGTKVKIPHSSRPARVAMTYISWLLFDHKTLSCSRIAAADRWHKGEVKWPPTQQVSWREKSINCLLR
jgi:hypothetical protein